MCGGLNLTKTLRNLFASAVIVKKFNRLHLPHLCIRGNGHPDLGLDFAGPFQGKLFFVMIDAHSKWIEAVCTSSTSSQIVIEELRTVFSKFGLPETIVTDNGSSFTSQEFREFLKNNGIRHTTSAPYHPASNGS